MVQQLLRLTSLSSIELSFDCVSEPAAKLMEAEMRCLSNLKSMSMRMPGVAELPCQGEGPEDIHRAVRGIGQLTALTRLDLAVPDVSEGCLGSWSNDQMWGEFLRPVSSLHALRDLRCKFSRASEEPSQVEGQQDLSGAFSLVHFALPSLTLLTRLKLEQRNTYTNFDRGLGLLFVEGEVTFTKLPQLCHLVLGAVSLDEQGAEVLPLARSYYLQLPDCLCLSQPDGMYVMHWCAYATGNARCFDCDLVVLNLYCLYVPAKSRSILLSFTHRLS